jgi:thioredoxin 1
MIDQATSENYNTKVLGAELPVLVKVGATWCGPCGIMNPILEELTKEVADKMHIVNVDVDDSPDVANELNVENVPTFVVFQNGQELGRRVGAVSKQELVIWAGEAITGA